MGIRVDHIGFLYGDGPQGGGGLWRGGLVLTWKSWGGGVWTVLVRWIYYVEDVLFYVGIGALSLLLSIPWRWTTMCGLSQDQTATTLSAVFWELDRRKYAPLYSGPFNTLIYLDILSTNDEKSQIYLIVVANKKSMVWRDFQTKLF